VFYSLLSEKNKTFNQFHPLIPCNLRIFYYFVDHSRSDIFSRMHRDYRGSSVRMP